MPRKRKVGSVFQRKDGIWVAALSRVVDGRRERDVLYASSEADARANLQELRNLSDAGQKPNRDSLGAFLDSWLTTVKATLAASTHDDYERQVRLYVKPIAGLTALRRVTPAAIDALLVAVESPRTRLKVYMVLRAAFRYARRKRLVPENPMDFVDVPAYRPEPRKPWSVKEAKAFLAAIRGDKLEALYALAIYSGMREGELFALEPADVDLAAGTVSPRRSLENINGRRRSTAPKTEQSRRRIDVPSDCVRLLRSHMKQSMATKASKYVFSDSIGGPLSRQNFLVREWYPLLARSNIRRIAFHDLRHTMATLMLSLNEHPKIVQEKLGHSRVGTTLDTYSHVAPTMGRLAAGRLQRALKRR